MCIYKSGEKVLLKGTYVEVGQGGGKVRGGKVIQLEVGDSFPTLKPYSIVYLHKKKETSKDRQHKWKLCKQK